MLNRHERVEHPAVRQSHKLLKECRSPHAYILLSYRTDYEAGIVVDSNLTDQAILDILQKIIEADRQGILLEAMAAEHEQH